MGGRVPRTAGKHASREPDTGSRLAWRAACMTLLASSLSLLATLQVFFH
jgi:hypothetical protein